MNKLDLGATRRAIFVTCLVTEIIESLQRMLSLRLTQDLEIRIKRKRDSIDYRHL